MCVKKKKKVHEDLLIYAPRRERSTCSSTARSAHAQREAKKGEGQVGKNETR